MNTAEDLKNRIRKVDLSKMSDEQAAIIGEQIGVKLCGVMTDAVEKANQFLQVYGLKVKMQYCIETLEKESKGE